MVERGGEVREEAQGGCVSSDFELFFDSIWPRAIRMVIRMGLGRDDAEDVVLESLAVVYERWRRVAGLEYRDGWALKVAANRALRQLRRRSRSTAHLNGTPIVMDDEVTTRLFVREGIGRLPRRQREVIALRYLADMSEEEVAQALGMNVGTVKQHASRGRLHLRATLDVEGGDSRVR